MGAEVERIVVSYLRKDIFYAQIIVSVNGNQLAIDSRPSDAIALAVRAKVPIYVEDSVMARAAVTPDEDIESETAEPEASGGVAASDDELSIFKDFVDTLDLDDLGDE